MRFFSLLVLLVVFSSGCKLKFWSMSSANMDMLAATKVEKFSILDDQESQSINVDKNISALFHPGALLKGSEVVLTVFPRSQWLVKNINADWAELPVVLTGYTQDVRYQAVGQTVAVDIPGTGEGDVEFMCSLPINFSFSESMGDVAVAYSYVEGGKKKSGLVLRTITVDKSNNVANFFAWRPGKYQLVYIIPGFDMDAEYFEFKAENSPW
jgi:hypothetical protein